MQVHASLMEELPARSRVLIYGAGEFGEMVFEKLRDAGIEAVGFIDGQKTGTFCDLPIVSPAKLGSRPVAFDLVVLALGSYRQAFKVLKAADIAECHLLYLERELFRVEQNRMTPDTLENLNGKIGYLEWMLTKRNNQYEAAMELLYGKPVYPSAPPSKVPDELLDAFTMQGKMKLKEEYFNSTRPKNHPIIYTDREIDSYIPLIKEEKPAYYAATDQWLYSALRKYSLAGKRVLIIGSNCPWYESMCIAHNAVPHVVDYGSLVTTSDRIKIISSEEAWATPDAFDACLSISSMEHDGLGAYGDPINPNGDLETMQRTLKVLKPGGLLYLSVPVGEDALRYNYCRVYGPLRLAKVLEGWKLKDSFGFSEDQFETGGDIQPVFILEKP
ncbi:MAG: DUF268 domain-containing protein [Humidesulfovibrio sp.]|uniref:DUF268 domain-containing protein n=1 Tax=Humidesulfovibrio sp. TaxID=2910988 RepID=UPI0027332E80|nr:DUF268 domain-containing protein [Humidesulfovibrio sp.]MDP2848342.1 DUF268 domain-containing protein [Humidesulfovibrio sp.]